MRMRVAALAIALVVPVLAPAFARASDASATEAYLRANYALVKAGHANLGLSIAAYKGVLATVRRECPQAAAESPQDPESTDLSNELIGTMVLSAGKPDRGAIQAYLRAVSGLRWSSVAVTHAVAAYAANLRKLYALEVPDLCGDIRAWATNHFASLPQSTLSFVKVFYPNWVALGLLPPGLARFESAGTRSLAQGSARFEYQLTNVEAEAVETWASIMDTLELNP